MTTAGIPGKLCVVATPIGNLRDISPRAIEALRQADLIAAEDTRHTRILTDHYQIRANFISFFEYNKRIRTEQILDRLREGKTVALVCDAGTPGISDPGFYLIRAAVEKGVTIESVPGPTALIAALVLSGLPTDKFVFEGFLPSKPGARRRRLTELAGEERTMIFYESPHRLLKTLADVKEILGERRLSVSRELTKKFEETKRGTVSEIGEYFGKGKVRGELVLVMEGKPK